MTTFQPGDIVALSDGQYWYRQEDGTWRCLTARGSITEDGRGLLSLATDRNISSQAHVFVVREHRVIVAERRIPEYGNAPRPNPRPFGPTERVGA